MLKRPLSLLAAATMVLAVSACGSDNGSDQATDQSSQPSRAATGPACTYSADGRQPAKDVGTPPDHAAVSGQEKVTIKTNFGDIGATLDADATPCTVNSFVHLADKGYYDNTVCHRLTTQGIYVLQCGDPTGKGSGGPGYSFPDELSGKETYPAGTLAMANAGPDTNGSQFFMVYADTPLPPAYTVFGHLDAAGLKVVKAIADKGTADGGPDGAPKDKVEIQSVTAQ